MTGWPSASVVAHGRMPETLPEWLVWGLVVGVCAWVLWKCVQWSVRPREDDPNHVKRSILDGAEAAGPARPPAAVAPSSPRPSPLPKAPE